jgi:hypothetical protein
MADDLLVDAGRLRQPVRGPLAAGLGYAQTVA